MWERNLDGDFECVAMLEGHSQDVKFLCWDSQNILYSSAYDDLIKLWRETNDEWICFQTLSGHLGTVWGLAVSSEDRAVVSCSDDRSIRLWHIDSLNYDQNCTIEDLHTDVVYSIDWNTKLKLIVTGGGDNSLAICELVGDHFATDYHLEKVYYLKDCHDGDVNCVRWNPKINPSTHDLLTSSDDETIKIWSLER